MDLNTTMCWRGHGWSTGLALARFAGAMGATIGPDDMLEFKSVPSLTEAGAERPVLAAMLGL